MKIAHIADVHIRNLKYHETYKKVFKNLYKKLRAFNLDAIVVCGDLAHNKTNISPEYVSLASSFMLNLSKIAYTIVIPGNHDGNLKNLSREDAISPIAKSINSSNLKYVKKAGEFSIPGSSSYVFNHISVFDRENREKPSDLNKINIGLYHGALAGAKTDTGFVINKGDDGVGIFEGLDFAFLGDIHKANQVMDSEGRVRYPGSLIQQNFGEDEEKGFLLWDIKSKNDFEVEFIEVENPNKFVTIRSKDDVGHVEEGSRVRIALEEKISTSEKSKLEKLILSRKPSSISYKNIKLSSTGQNLNTQNIVKDSDRQNKIIEKILEDYDDNLVERVKKLNNELEKEFVNNFVEKKMWKLERAEWSNLFSFGESNEINFGDMEGTLGILGKNYTGKSSVLEAISFGLYGSVAKKIRKNSNIINHSKDEGYIELDITTGDSKYKLRRDITREGENVSTQVKLTKDGNPFNADTKTATDSLIAEIFGGQHESYLTWFMPQNSINKFVDLTESGRRNLLVQFLELSSFDKKYDYARDKFTYYKNICKNLSNKLENYSDEVDLRLKLEDLKVRIETKESNHLEKVEKEIKYADKQKYELKAELKALPRDLIDIDSLKKNIEKEISLSEKLSAEIEEISNDILLCEQNKKELEEALESTSIEKLEENKQNIDLLKKQLDKTTEQIEDYQRKLNIMEEKISWASVSPCDASYTKCKLIEDTRTELKELQEDKKFFRANISYKEKLLTEIEKVDYTNLLKKIEELDKASENLKEIRNILQNLNIKKENKELSLSAKKNKIDELKRKLEKARNDAELLETKRDKEAKLEKVVTKLVKLEDEKKSLKSIISSWYSDLGLIKQKIKERRDLGKELAQAQDSYDLYKAAKVVFHSKGIPFYVIKNNIDTINKEINKILSAMVDFSVHISDNDLTVYIKHPEEEARVIELGSGAERVLTSLAIRIALLNISNVSHPQMLFLDEPADGLDPEHTSIFIEALCSLSEYFDNVVVITHMQSIKDHLDDHIFVEKTPQGSILV